MSLRPGRIVEVADAIYRVALVPGDHLNSYLIVRDGQVTLIDAGLPVVSPPAVLRCLDLLGVRRSQVARVVATHAHLDHVGGLARIQRATHAKTATHAADSAFISSGKTPPFDRSTRLGTWANRLVRFGFPRAAVDEFLTHGQLMPEAGLEVVHTPGHTPGHICLLHPDSGVLIIGDALYNFGGHISWPNYATCWDYALAKSSARKLVELNFAVACFGHGPELTTDAKAAISDLVVTHT